jgi:glycosyltransferase involved in cell wall biosynthesis
VILLRGGANHALLKGGGANVCILSRRPLDPAIVGLLVDHFWRNNADIIYLWQRPFDVYGAIASIIARKKFVFAERTNPSRINCGLKVFLRLAAAQFASAIIANSESGTQYWKRFARAGCKVTTIRNILPAVELGKTIPSSEAIGKALFVGRIDKNKNVLTLLQAIKVLRDQGVLIPAVIVGSGDELPSLASYIDSHNLEALVSLVGRKADVWPMMKACTVFVSLSFFEGEPNAVLEAAALGCRLVLSDIPEHRNALGSEFKRVEFISPESVEDVSLALKRAFYSVDGEALSMTGHEPLVSSRIPSEIARQHISIFREIIGLTDN